MQRILAHKVVYRGQTHSLSVVEIGDNDEIKIMPFETEGHSTIFINGTIEIIENADGTVTVKRC